MAMATKRTSDSSPAPGGPSAARTTTGRSFGGLILAGVYAIYRFLASLKLAVISLSGLAAYLAFATWFESRYGTNAVQEFVYQSAWFSLVLAFLAINILCAVLVRIPLKRRQTGFAVTHLGLLIMIAGSYVHFKTGDEGIVGMLEGESRSELLRIDSPMFRVREIDPHSRETLANYELPFEDGGPFAWGGGQPQIKNIFDLTLNMLSGGRLPVVRPVAEELSKAGDPFKLVAREYLPASAPATLRVADPTGQPMARIQLQFKGPGMAEAMPALPNEDDQWFKLDKRFHRTARSAGMPVLVTFSSVDKAGFLDDFLNPPLEVSEIGVARFRYADEAGEERVFDLPLETPAGEEVKLPESDLTVTLDKLAHFPTSEGGLNRIVGENSIPIAMFKIRKGDGEEVDHVAMGSMPMFPNIIPRPGAGADVPDPLVAIHLMIPPDLQPGMEGRIGQIDVLEAADKTLYYRVFGRDKENKPELRAAGPLKEEAWIDAFGGENAVMSIDFRVADYLPAGVEKQIFQPVFLPKGQMDTGIAACRVELTVGDQTQEIWLQRNESLDAPAFRPVPFGDRLFEIAYDSDRRPLGFDVKLEDFEVGFEPGTEQPTKFVSQVKLSDPSLGIEDQPHTISMNEPMTHRGYTFYQMRYSPIVDPRTGQRTGQFQSVFQVGSNPGRTIIYTGCFLIVFGTYLQFYMRAGLFSDGGKREREMAARKAGLPIPAPEPSPSKAEEEIL